MKHFYLENRNGGAHKFWRGVLVDRFFLGNWGRIGTLGQKRLWRDSSHHAAMTRFDEKMQSKRDAGYSEASDPEFDPEWAYKVIGGLLNKASYCLSWRTHPGHPIIGEHLIQAATQAEDCLEALGHPHGTYVRCYPHANGVGVRILAEDKEVLFGYPAPEVVARWTTDDLREPPDRYPSREGWLGSDGTGSGVITTDRGWIDLPVRVFLARLIAASGLEVVDNYDQPLSGFVVDSTASALPQQLLRPFRWQSVEAELIDVLRRHGWVPGLVRQSDSPIELIGFGNLSIPEAW